MINLIHGECLAEMDKLIKQGITVDAIITDPPYGTTDCKWDSVIPLEAMWQRLNKIIKSNGAIVMTASQPFTTTLISSNMKMFKYCWVWEKSKASNFVHANFQPLKAHEDICVWSFGGSAQGSKTPMMYNPQYKDGVPYHKGFGQRPIENLAGGLTKAENLEIKNETGKRKPRSVFYHKTAESEGKHHPTQKPIGLMEYLIKTYTNEGETVLDFTMGSGTTGVACKNLRRNFIGIEMDNDYFKIAEKRISENNMKNAKEQVVPTVPTGELFTSEWGLV